MIKKHFRIIAPLMMLVTITSCVVTSSGDENGPSEEVVIELSNDYKTELKILIPSGNLNEESMIDKAIEGFNLKYPNISFKKNFVSVNSYENIVKNQALAGTLADIVWTNSPDYYTLVNSNIAEPLNEYFELSEEKGDFNFSEDFLTEYFDMGAVKGKYYAVPRSADSVVTFYNKKLLSAAGIDLSIIKNGWTWDDFLLVNEQYRQYLDRNGLNTYYVTDANLTTWLSTSYPILRSFGADVLNPEGEVILDSEETREALTLARDLMTKRYIVPSGDTPGSSFEVGTAPFLFQSASVSLFAERRELKNNIDIVSFPLIMDKNMPKIGTGIAGYSMNRKSKEKPAAWAFLNHLMSKEGQNNLASGGLNLPSIRHDLANFEVAAWGEGYRDFNLSAYTYGPEYKIDQEFLSYVDARHKADLDLAIRDLFTLATRQDKTIEDAIAASIRSINASLSQR